MSNRTQSRLRFIINSLTVIQCPIRHHRHFSKPILSSTTICLTRLFPSVSHQQSTSTDHKLLIDQGTSPVRFATINHPSLLREGMVWKMSDDHSDHAELVVLLVESLPLTSTDHSATKSLSFTVHLLINRIPTLGRSEVFVRVAVFQNDCLANSNSHDQFSSRWFVLLITKQLLRHKEPSKLSFPHKNKRRNIITDKSHVILNLDDLSPNANQLLGNR